VGAAIAFNLLMLAIYKYTDFLVGNLNLLFSSRLPLPDLVLPLAISFFTFTQIAYLIDSYRGETAEYDLLNYALFVTFFPHLIAGPIVHHRDIMKQFASPRTLVVRYHNIGRGLFIFGIGLFKKLVIADTFAVWATGGFDSGQALDFYSAWVTSLSYSFQIYFDFSGYCDMAIGAALLFNIWLPINFNSPYKALDIQEFWRRWHITLSNFLRDYLYIPLGGNRRGELRTSVNLFVTFLLGGLWHGPSWMFVAWGAMHGAALVLHRLWQRLGRPLPAAVAWLVTFLFVNTTWVLFRAKTWGDAMNVLQGMVDIGPVVGLSAAVLPTSAFAWGGWLVDDLITTFPANLIAHTPSLAAIAAALFLIRNRNSLELSAGSMGLRKATAGALVFSLAMHFTLTKASTVFLYYNF
jgi:D-alanyl-lipoteichoic acid acyltransferase DltB (MBOAT superfamily)